MPLAAALRRLAPLALAGLASCRSGPASSGPADLVVYGRVWTGDSARPWAGAVAVSGDTVAAVGDSAEIAELVGPSTRVLANGDGLVTPGFMDGHLHFLDGGYQLASVDLRSANGKSEFIQRVVGLRLRASAGRVDCRRRLGPRALARHPAPATELDRLGHPEQPGPALPPRRAHGAGQLGRAAAGQDGSHAPATSQAGSLSAIPRVS